eukprot:COSAG04_NODE_428_length_14528_cov_24.451036_4_plen_80_part_00
MMQRSTAKAERLTDRSAAAAKHGAKGWKAAAAGPGTAGADTNKGTDGGRRWAVRANARGAPWRGKWQEAAAASKADEWI